MTELLTLEQGKTAIGRPTLDAEQESLLAVMVGAVLPVIENIVGYVETRTVQLATFASRLGVELPHRVNSVSSITRAGVPVTAYALDADGAWIGAGAADSPSWWSPGPMLITAEVGLDPIPKNITFAAMELLRHWWQIGQQGARPTSWGEPAGEPWTPSGFAVPRRVSELLEPNTDVGGFA